MALSITSTTAFVSKLNSANPLTITTTTSVIPSPSTSTCSSSSSQPGISSFGRVALPEKKLANDHLISSTSNIGNYLSANSFVAAAPMRRKLLPTSIKESCVDNSCLARVWRKIQGCNNWKDLMQPLNPLLRDEIIRYGEFVTACYKAFDLDPNSKRYLNCKYGKKNMMSQVGMANSGYEITKYIYATPDISIPTQTGTCCSRWIGYVAVSSDEETRRLGRRDVVITFRGTVTNTEWIANFMSSLTPARLDPQNPLPDVKVESGFLSLYTSDDRSCRFGVGSCRQQLLSEVSRILNMYKGEEMSITLAGHSMGSSLAVLLAYDIAELGVNKTRNQNEQIPVTVYSFGGPRVGNSSFKNRCEELGVKVLRVVNINDPVTKLPGVLFNENFRVFGGKYEFPWSCSCYAHVGVELALDFFEMQNPSCVHDLETYIGLLKCPKRAQTQNDNINGAHEDILNKALMFLFGAQLLVTLCNL